MLASPACAGAQRAGSEPGPPAGSRVRRQAWWSGGVAGGGVAPRIGAGLWRLGRRLRSEAWDSKEAQAGCPDEVVLAAVGWHGEKAWLGELCVPTLPAGAGGHLIGSRENGDSLP